MSLVSYAKVDLTGTSCAYANRRNAFLPSDCIVPFLFLYRCESSLVRTGQTGKDGRTLSRLSRLSLRYLSESEGTPRSGSFDDVMRSHLGS